MKDYYAVYYEEAKTVYKGSAEDEDEARRKGDDLTRMVKPQMTRRFIVARLK